MPRIKQDPRQKQEQKKRRTGMFMSLFLSFLLILLTSSFVLHYIYRGAANVEMTVDGVDMIYRAAIGDTVFTPSEADETNSEDTSEEEYDELEDLEGFDSTEDKDTQSDQENKENSSESSSNRNEPLYTDGTGIR